jgi:hypothetical protein
MGLGLVLPNALGIGEVGLDGHDLRHAEFDRFLDNEIGPRLFDRGKQEPEVCACSLRAGLILAGQDATAFAGRGDFGQPFAIAAIENQYLGSDAFAHDAEKVMRLRLGQGQ